MTIYLKQSTASQEVPLGYFVDSTDGNTEETGLTIANTDIKLWKTGATTLANKNSGGATHISNGIYYAVLDATDTDTLGPLVIFVHVAGALTVRLECVVLAANVYDSLIGGGDLLDVNVSQFGNANGTFASGRPEVNTTHVGGTVQTAGDIIGDTNDIQTRLPAALVGGRMDASVGAMAANTVTASAVATDAVDEIVDAVWDEVLTGATHNVTNSAGRRLRQVRSALYTGTAQAGAATSITLDTGASTTNNLYQGEIVSIVSGTGAGQTRSIVNYVGSTRVATVDRAWITNPDNTSVFEIVGTDERNILQDGIAAGGASTSITLSSGASATDDIYNGQTVFLSAGTGAQQARLITDYNGTTKVATISPAWTTTPDTTSIYQIMPVGQVVVESLTTTALGAVADSVWDEPLAGHATSGSTGAALSAAGSAGDPWSTALPGAYGAGTAGNIIGNNLDAAVSSRLSSASYTAPLDAAATRSAVGLAAANLDTQLSGIQTDTNDIQTRLPAALVGGRMDASVGAMAADVVTASAVAASAVTEIQSGLASQTSVDTLAGYVDTEVAAIKAQTDKLTFNASNAVKANITHVIDDAVQQNGSTTTNWGGTP